MKCEVLDLKSVSQPSRALGLTLAAMFATAILLFVAVANPVFADTPKAAEDGKSDQEAAKPAEVPAAAPADAAAEASADPAKKVEAPAKEDESVFETVRPPEVQKSPVWRERRAGENAEDYLGAIGLVRKKGIWRLASEAAIELLIQQAAEGEKKIGEKQRAAKKKIKVDKSKLTLQKKKEEKALKKRFKKMKKWDVKKAVEASNTKWKNIFEKDARRLSVDPKTRFENGWRLQKKFKADKNGYENEQLTISYYPMSEGDLTAVAAAKAAAKKLEEEFNEAKKAYAIAYEADVSARQSVLSLSERAVWQLKRTKFEYKVLAAISSITKAVKEAGGKLRSPADLDVERVKAETLFSDCQLALGKLLAQDPFSDSLFQLPRHFNRMKGDAGTAIGEIDSVYAAVAPADHPVAFLLAKGLANRRGDWHLRLEKQVGADLEFSAGISLETQRLAGIVSEGSRRDLMARKKNVDQRQMELQKDLQSLYQSKIGAWILGWRKLNKGHLGNMHAVQQQVEKLLAVDDAVADLKAARSTLLTESQDRVVRIGEAYGVLYEDEGIMEAMGKAGGGLKASQEFESANRTLRGLLKPNE